MNSGRKFTHGFAGEPEPRRGDGRQTGMTRLRGPWTAAAAVTLFLLTACAQNAPDTGTAGSGAGATPGRDADTVVLRVRHSGGFVTPDLLLGRLPLVSVYADGRVITEGPQIMIYPAPALPNVQVQQIDPVTVDDLVARATAAGVRPGADFGQPNVADAPTTHVDVLTPDGMQSVAVVALQQAQPDDARLTPAQRDARAKLAAFTAELTGLPTAPGEPEPQPYRAETLAALARPYLKPADDLPSQPPAVPWPGPALPGDYLTEGIKLGCVTASGAEADQILAAADQANANTPWTSGGNTFTVTFRPLLPDETGCADLKAAR